MRFLKLALLLTGVGFSRPWVEIQIPLETNLKFSGDRNTPPVQYKIQPKIGIILAKYFQVGLEYSSQVHQLNGWNLIPKDPQDSASGFVQTLYKVNSYQKWLSIFAQADLRNARYFERLYPFLGASFGYRNEESDMYLFVDKKNNYEKFAHISSNTVLHTSVSSQYFGMKFEANNFIGVFASGSYEQLSDNLIGSFKSDWQSLSTRIGFSVSI